MGGSPPPPAESEPAWTDGSPAAPLARSCPGRGRSRSGPGLHAQGSEGEDAIRPQRLRSCRAHAQRTAWWYTATATCRPMGSAPRASVGAAPGWGRGRADPHPVAGGPRDRKQEVNAGHVDTVATRLPVHSHPRIHPRPVSADVPVNGVSKSHQISSPQDPQPHRWPSSGHGPAAPRYPSWKSSCPGVTDSCRGMSLQVCPKSHWLVSREKGA